MPSARSGLGSSAGGSISGRSDNAFKIIYLRHTDKLVVQIHMELGHERGLHITHELLDITRPVSQHMALYYFAIGIIDLDLGGEYSLDFAYQFLIQGSGLIDPVQTRHLPIWP